jgi:hypothetical protein
MIATILFLTASAALLLASLALAIIIYYETFKLT